MTTLAPNPEQIFEQQQKQVKLLQAIHKLPANPTEGRSNAHYGRLLGEGSCLSAQHLSGCRQVEPLSGKYEAGFADHCQLRIESQWEHDQRVSDLQKKDIGEYDEINSSNLCDSGSGDR